jgi:hypothetical protein
LQILRPEAEPHCWHESPPGRNLYAKRAFAAR